jgi:hypothetical protein
MADATYSDLIPSTALNLHYDASDITKAFTDAACTTQVTDGGTVLGWAPTSIASSTAKMTGTAGPVYRSNYASSGYAALESNGTTHRLFNTSLSLGISRFAVLCCYTRISGAASTVWMRGSVSVGRMARLIYVGSGALQTYLQYGIASSYAQTQPPSAPAAAKSVVLIEVSDVGSRCSFDSYNCSGASVDALDGSMPDSLYLFAGDNGGFYQGANIAMHELILATGADWSSGGIMDAAKVMATKWGVTNENPTPQTSGGSASSRMVNIRGGADQ